MSKLLIGGMFLVAGVGCVTDAATDDTEGVVDHKASFNEIPNNFPFLDPTGFAATYDVTGRNVDENGDFFTALGTNGRTCGSCHLAETGWSIIPSELQNRFERTDGLDPVFRLVDGSVSPNADVSTKSKRHTAYSMLLNKGLIRIGIGVPANAEYTLVAVDDPYKFASAAQLSLFRRPLQSANLFFLSTVMWDGRETLVDTNTPHLPTSNCLRAPFAVKCFLALNSDLDDQSNQATLGHAQAMVPGLTAAQEANIVAFENGLMFAQAIDFRAGFLNDDGALGGPDKIPSFPSYFGINDNFGDYDTNAPFTATIFSLYDNWAHSNSYFSEERKHRESVARGQALFNSKPITISGVGGLNNALGLPASFSGTCGTCHDTPQGGNHSVPAPLNIGVADASRRTADLPLYTMQCSAVGIAAGDCTAGQTVQSTDPGRALITGKFADIGRFKGPTLRGIAARAPYFHNGSAADLGAVVDFYDTRFGIGFTDQEKRDLIAFLESL